MNSMKKTLALFSYSGVIYFYKRLILYLLPLNNLQYANEIIKFIDTKFIQCVYKWNIDEIRMK